MTWDYIAGYFDGEGCAGVYDDGRVWHVLFINTDRGSLEAIRDFLNAGVIRSRARAAPHHRPTFVLSINRVDDIRRIAPELIKRCLIKGPALTRVLNHVATKRGVPNHGAVTQVGQEEIRRLYWDEGLSLAAIGVRIGVDYRAVQQFMSKNGIPRRPRTTRYAVERHQLTP